MARVDEPAIRDRDEPLLDRHLHAACTGAGHEPLDERDAPAAKRSQTTGTGPIDVHRPGPSAARIRRIRASLNDPTQTRSRLLVERMSSTSGADGLVALRLEVEPQRRPRREHLVEPGDRLLAAHPGLADLARRSMSRIEPFLSVNPSSVGVVEGQEHAVLRRHRVGLEERRSPRATVASKAGQVFSRCSAPPPAWENGSGPGYCRNGNVAAMPSSIVLSCLRRVPCRWPASGSPAERRHRRHVALRRRRSSARVPVVLGSRRRPGRRHRQGRSRRRPRCRSGSGPRSSTAPRPGWPSATERVRPHIAVEAAKPIKTARVEAERAVGTFQFAAAEARKLAGEMIPLDAGSPGEGKLGFTLRVPIGVVGAISPFNFPLNLVAHKLAPAIAAGCPVVLKPASQTPFSAIALAELLLDECGLPGRAAERRDRAAAAPSATPSSTTPTSPSSPSPARPRSAGASGRGRRASASASSSATTPPSSSSPTATGRRRPTRSSVAGFSHAGQSCISTQRVYVHRSIADDFTAALAERVRSLVVGDPLDERTDVSALISPGERDRVTSWIAEARGRRGQGRGGRRARRRRRPRADPAHRRRSPT